MKLIPVSPYDFARPIAQFRLEPESQVFFQIFPEANEVISSKPRKKKTYKNLRQETLAPDSVEAVRLWKAGNGHGTRYSKALSKIQARSEQRESKMPYVSSGREVSATRPKNPNSLCAKCSGKDPTIKNKGMTFGVCCRCENHLYLFPNRQ